MAKGPGQVMPTSLLEHQPQGRGGADGRPRTPPNCGGISDSFSNALSPRLGLFVNIVVDAMSVVPWAVTQLFMNATELCRPTFDVHRLPIVLAAATTTTHASTPTRASLHRRPTANVSHRRETRVGIRARATGFRRSSARVQLN